VEVDYNQFAAQGPEHIVLVIVVTKLL